MKRIKNHTKLRTFLFLILVFILMIYLLFFKFSSKKYENVDYAIKRYTTTGLLNKYRLYSLENYEIKFSDGNLCIAEITGIEDKSPYQTVIYNLYLEKSKSGKWKLLKVYSSK
ncbi:MAG: hypothetical protein RSA29_16865 [Clostridium sp.]|uniref:hypothetical protein n=1 Tax=Clostridium sp. TaxID=1506 RepID=UPI003035B164